ncbi:unnamed protein product [Caenorhabditis nigoni]
MSDEQGSSFNHQRPDRFAEYDVVDFCYHIDPSTFSGEPRLPNITGQEVVPSLLHYMRRKWNKAPEIVVTPPPNTNQIFDHPSDLFFAPNPRPPRFTLQIPKPVYEREDRPVRESREQESQVQNLVAPNDPGPNAPSVETTGVFGTITRYFDMIKRTFGCGATNSVTPALTPSEDRGN